MTIAALSARGGVRLSSNRSAVAALAVALISLNVVPPADAHDPSAWGGIFRSRDSGASWLPANEGRFVAAALDLAVSRTDRDHLLLATESGLLRSRNGGRDWELQGVGVLEGTVFAVAFGADGEQALASTAAGIFRSDGQAWVASPTQEGATPARAIMASGVSGRAYLLGWKGLFRSDDWGQSWAVVETGLPAVPTALALVARAAPEVVLVVAGGEPWISLDAGRTWERRNHGLPAGNVQTIASGPADSVAVWAAVLDTLCRSDDLGVSWYAVGRPLPEADTTVRGIAVSPDSTTITLSTHRGLYRSSDAGQTWELLIDDLPVHLEARPLVRDLHDPVTLYAGFSIMPYDALWQDAAGGGNSLARLDALDLAGGLAFLALLALAAGAMLRRLARYYRPAGTESTMPAIRSELVHEELLR